MFAPSLLLLASLACMAAAHPFQSEMEHQWPLVRERRSPMAARTMILIRGQPTNAGYHYARPERAFNPRAAMATYATGGTVATGHYYGAATERQKQNCGHCKQLVDEQPDEEQTKAVEPPAPEEIPAEVDDTKGAAPERKPKAPKAPPKRRPVQEEEEEDDEEEEVATRKGSRRGGSTYTNFFPVMFGAPGRSRQRASDDEDDADDGSSVTAIANSFSKGRNAIASSSAVAYGRPGNNSQPRQSQASRYRS